MLFVGDLSLFLAAFEGFSSPLPLVFSIRCLWVRFLFTYFPWDSLNFLDPRIGAFQQFWEILSQHQFTYCLVNIISFMSTQNSDCFLQVSQFFFCFNSVVSLSDSWFISLHLSLTRLICNLIYPFFHSHYYILILEVLFLIIFQVYVVILYNILFYTHNAICSLLICVF